MINKIKKHSFRAIFSFIKRVMKGVRHIAYRVYYKYKYAILVWIPRIFKILGLTLLLAILKLLIEWIDINTFSFNTKTISELSIPLIGIQFSITFLVVSIISSLASRSENYIYGERIIDILFKKKVLIGFRGQVLVLIFTSMSNLFLYSYFSNPYIVISLFTISVVFLTSFILKMLSMVFPSRQIYHVLKLRYYKELIKEINSVSSSIKPLKPYADRLLNVNIINIKANNVYEYFECLNMQIDLITSAVKCKRVKYQIWIMNGNYITFIDNYFLQIRELVINGDIETALRFVFKLLTIHNKQNMYYCSFYLEEFLDILWSQITDIDSYKEFKHIKYYLNLVVMNIMLQALFYNEEILNQLKNKNSNVRINRIKGDVLKKYYCSIVDNKHLTSLEKSRILGESLIYLIQNLSLTDYWFGRIVRERINNPWNDEAYSTNNLKENINIIAIPIVELLLELVSKKEFNEIDNFLNCIPDIYVKHQTILIFHLVLIECYITNNDKDDLTSSEQFKVWIKNDECPLKCSIVDLEFYYYTIIYDFFEHKATYGSYFHNSKYNISSKFWFEKDTVNELFYLYSKMQGYSDLHNRIDPNTFSRNHFEKVNSAFEYMLNIEINNLESLQL